MEVKISCDRYIKGELTWLEEHAKYENGAWVCKTTNVPITNSIIGRSMGCGEVVNVNHLHCTKCQPDFHVQSGAPINEYLIEEVLDEVDV